MAEDIVKRLRALFREMSSVAYGGGEDYVVVPRKYWEALAAALKSEEKTNG